LDAFAAGDAHNGAPHGPRVCGAQSSQPTTVRFRPFERRFWILSLDRELRSLPRRAERDFGSRADKNTATEPAVDSRQATISLLRVSSGRAQAPLARPSHYLIQLPAEEPSVTSL
jgi:hypothetical protein